MSEQWSKMGEHWQCGCFQSFDDYYLVRLHKPHIGRCEDCCMKRPSDIPETVFGSVPVEVGEVPDMGAPVFGPFAAAEDRVVRRLAEGFPKAQYADTTGLQDHPLMKRIERKG